MRDGICHRTGGGAKVEHFHDLGLVEFDDARGDTHVAGDFFRRESLGYKLDDFPLPGSQIVHAETGTRLRGQDRLEDVFAMSGITK